MTKREILIRAVICAIAEVEGWDDRVPKHPSIWFDKKGGITPTQVLRSHIAYYQRLILEAAK